MKNSAPCESPVFCGLGSFHASIPLFVYARLIVISSSIWYRVSVSLCAHYPVSSHIVIPQSHLLSLSLVQPTHFGYRCLKCYAIIILSLRPLLVCFHPPSSSVQTVALPSSLSRRSRFSSLRSCIFVVVTCHISTPMSTPLLPRVILPPRSLLWYLRIPSTRLSCPFCGKASRSHFFVLALLGVSCTLCSRLYHCLAGCSTYPILVVAYCLLLIAYCLLLIAYCLLPIACRCRCYVSSQDQVRFPFCRVVNFESSSPSLPLVFGPPPHLLPPCSPASPQFHHYSSNASPLALHAPAVDSHLYALSYVYSS
jgi:hypothetical protein